MGLRTPWRRGRGGEGVRHQHFSRDIVDCALGWLGFAECESGRGARLGRREGEVVAPSVNRRRSHCYIGAISVIHKNCDSKWEIGDRCVLVVSSQTEDRPLTA